MNKYYENKKSTNLTRNCSTSTEILTSTSFDNVWDSFQEHYEYLMDEGLIDSCKLDKKALNSNYQTDNISLSEFTYQLNQLNKWLDRLRSFNSNSNTSNITTTNTSSTSSCCEKYANQVSMT
jgi:hypothetical protein